ncbi:MAG TPA: hypothetical protein VF902_10320, partial [Coriobacteriia bacterium]
MKGHNRRKAVALVMVLALAASLSLVLAAQAQAGSTPVVIGGGRPDAPAISGTNVVWADQKSGNWDLYRYDALTGATTQLTSGPADEAMPSVSGSRMAFVDFGTGLGDVVVRDIVTGVQTKLEVPGAQMFPSISGDWVAYEDRASRSSKVVFRNLAGGAGPYTGGVDGAPAARPVVAGDLGVYEDHSAEPSGRFDADVVMIDLATGAKTPIASSPASEIFATTDGRYIVWAQSTDTGTFKIRSFDHETGAYADITSGDGEETMPSIAGGFIYWIHNKSGSPLHVDRYEIATGKTSPFYTYSTGSVVALQASGANVAWLENSGKRRVRAVFNDGL